MGADVKVHPELAALEAQGQELDGLLGELEPSDWQRLSRCAPMTVRDVVAHLAGVLHFGASLARDEASGEPSMDRISWFRAYDPDELAPQILSRAQSEAEKRSDEEIHEWLRAELSQAVAVLGAGAPERLVGRKGVTLRAADLVATRVLELGIHTMDIGHAVLKGERLRPKAADVIDGIFRGLLGEILPTKLGWDTKTFILTAAGRRRLTANERYTLGPLADSFPLIR